MIKFFLASIVLVMAPLSYSEQTHNMDLASAERVVDEYRELRKLCIVSNGEDRRSCFQNLRSANDDYREAKALISTRAVEEVEQVYLVRFSYQ